LPSSRIGIASPHISFQESGMDEKEKGVIEKTIEAVEAFASEVKEVAKHMMDPPAPLKPGDEIVMLPMANDGLFGAPPTPQYIVVHHPKRRSKKAPKKTVKAAAKTKKPPAKKSSTKKKKKAANGKKPASKYNGIGKKRPGKKTGKKKKAKKSKR
jgi:hypothetical protein